MRERLAILEVLSGLFSLRPSGGSEKSKFQRTFAKVYSVSLNGKREQARKPRIQAIRLVIG
jgi:hypothetical protein